ncbi:hypothetical protein [Massilia scottii]|uniref:hypothetical protein n=1 Tax=Massilia scottii TaxID=3057166 RepID=UPI002796D8AC|nr:hypothetical protein [Massilia sp. CCM 9029]MDQ1832102.1 hypothetical protein [Massilia sp. CCM 9029]
MKTLTKYALMLGFSFLFAAGSINSWSADDTGFDFSRESPTDFLIFLQKNKNQKIYFIREPVVNWLNDEHIPALIDLLDSQEECMSVALRASSMIQMGSTVGNEAAFLITGYRAGKFPANLSSRTLSEEDKNEIRAWWREIQTNNTFKRRSTHHYYADSHRPWKYPSFPRTLAKE